MAMDVPNLKARLCRKAGQPMGMALSFSSSSRFLVVTRVERGIVKKWNDGRDPGERIAPGDLVFVVNGVEGTDGMMAVLRNASILEFDIEFAKSTGAEACDHPELREDLRRALPEYQVSWAEVTAAILQSKQAGGFLKKGPQHSFEVKLLRTGMLELTDPAPRPKGAKHQKEFARVSALAAAVGEREALRRRGGRDGGGGTSDEAPLSGAAAPPSGPPGAQAAASAGGTGGLDQSPHGAAPASGGKLSFMGVAAEAPPPPTTSSGQPEVGSKPGSRPNGKFTSSMKALAESYGKGELSEGQFQQRAAAVVGWELLAV